MNVQREKMQPETPQQYSVLLVDDDERVRNALAWFFRHSAGWHLLDAVADGASALRLAAALHPDLIVLDFWLPDSTYASLLPHLCALQPPPRVVVMTSELAPETCRQAIQLGAVACLSKLLDPVAILAELRRLCEPPPNPA